MDIVGAFPNISEKKLIREKVGILYLGACEVARSLQVWILRPGLQQHSESAFFGTPCMFNEHCSLAGLVQYRQWKVGELQQQVQGRSPRLLQSQCEVFPS